MTQPPDSQSALIDAAAERLQRAQRESLPCAPVRDLIGADQLELAYAVQERIAADRLATGARVVGRKIGLTSPAVQAQLGVDQPDFGILFADMEIADGGQLPIDQVLQPKVEAEIAFVLGADLRDGALELEQIRDSIDYAVAALEICGSRIANWDITFADTVADNASGGAFVLGGTRVALAEAEPRQAQMSMTINGAEVSTGSGAACLGDPLLAVQWLARQARDLGAPLLAGQVVLSGALGPMAAVSAGDLVTSTVTGYGSVSVRFTG